MNKSKDVVLLHNVTVDYGNGKGIFDINLKIQQGQVYGLMGPSGAGKSTLLRALLGFVKTTSGKVQINGVDVWNNTGITNKNIGYISGEPIIPNSGTGKQFLKYYAKLRNIKNLSRMDKLVKYFELDINCAIKDMSKGMKQRLAIIASLMNDYDIYVFDEPNSGLDPILSMKFIKTILELKRRNKTILISSHMMDEIQTTCDFITLIKDGKQIYNDSIQSLTNSGLTVSELFWQNYDDVKPFGEENEFSN